jgi:hypothetical protein
LAEGRSVTDHVVSHLIAKRAELADIINKLQREIDQHRADLAHLDGVLRILASDIDPETIRPTRRNRRTLYFARKELQRICLNVFRVAEGVALSAEEITTRAMMAKGFDPKDAVLHASIRGQIGSLIKRLHRDGTVENVGIKRASKWKLAGP